MTRKERYEFVLEYFSTHNPDAETELLYDSPYQLLVAVILSAQCTDKRVNMTTPAIFQHYPDAYALAKASFDELFPLIKSISYPNNKTKHLIGMARMLVEKFNGEVPLTIEELVQLPGVGRKTANVITSVVDNQPTMAVDTHVFRVSARIGLTVNAKTPLAAERQLLEFIPTEQVHIAHHWLILHGRYVCVARSPKCPECALQQACKYFAKHYGAAAVAEPKLPVLKLAPAARGSAASVGKVNAAPVGKVTAAPAKVSAAPARDTATPASVFEASARGSGATAKVAAAPASVKAAKKQAVVKKKSASAKVKKKGR